MGAMDDAVENGVSQGGIAEHGAMPQCGTTATQIRVIDAVRPLSGQPLEVSPSRLIGALAGSGFAGLRARSLVKKT